MVGQHNYAERAGGKYPGYAHFLASGSAVPATCPGVRLSDSPPRIHFADSDTFDASQPLRASLRIVPCAVCGVYTVLCMHLLCVIQECRFESL